MSALTRTATFAAAIACLGGAARADPPPAFDARVEQIRTAVGVPGMAVTMDYSAERLNIALDEADMIVSVTCG